MEPQPATRLCVVPSELAAAHQSPEFRNKWPRFGELVREIERCLLTSRRRN
jgi:hypothetical protein